MKGSLSTIDHYISLGMTPSKMNLGIAFYAKFFKTTGQCTQPIGCPTVLLEDANGGDTGQSGAVTFAEVPPVLSSGVADADEGGQWYWDASTSYFWTWDTPDFIAQKFEQIVGARGLGGVSKLFPTFPMHLNGTVLVTKKRMLTLCIVAWSLGEDSADLTYIKAMQSGLATL